MTISSRHPVMLILAGLAAWMTIAVLNNATDTGTNLFNLRNMISMEALSQDMTLGNGIEWRAWKQVDAKWLLYPIIVWQVATAAVLWWASVAQMLAARSKLSDEMASSWARLALSMFAGMWLVFLCGGLWFGYWMKQGPIQQVHFTLLILSVCCLTLVNVSRHD